MRLYLTNTANTRVFNVTLPGARMKLVGGDSGRSEREEFIAEVMLAPSERAVVDVRFDTPGELTLAHRTPDQTSTLARITVTEDAATPSLTNEFEVLQRGATTVPGLYFLGLPWQHTRGSGLLGWVKDDAEYIARAISSLGPGEL